MSISALYHYGHLPRRALSGAAWQSNRGRVLLSIMGVALGVALALAVHLINASAAREFARAARTLSGDADLVVHGPANGYSEDVFPTVATIPGVETASPALEIDARVTGHDESLHMIGMDSFRALRITPALLGNRFERLSALFDPDAVILSSAAAQWLSVDEGGELALQVGTGTVRLKVIAVLPAAVSAQRIAYADIATVQWRMQRLGLINRIDIRVEQGAAVAGVAARIAAVLPPGTYVGESEALSKENEAMTRAYRVNLNVLALIALVTGGFLVFTTQALTILQRRTQIAILRVLGVTRRSVLRILLIESGVMGAIGAAAGLVLGTSLAWFALARFGGDLGAGYYSGLTVELHADPSTLALYFMLGLAAAVAGCALPALAAARSDPAPALKAGSSGDFAPTKASWQGYAIAAAALPLALLPPWNGLPYGGYIAIAALLAGALMLAPAVAQALLNSVPTPRRAVAIIALQQLRSVSGYLSISISAILVSFSLMVAMLIMIASFRTSLEQWLAQVLPADVYVRAGFTGQTGFLESETASRVAALPAVARSVALRGSNITLAPGGPPVTLLARDLDPAHPEALPLRAGSAYPLHPKLPPVWISEAAVDLYGWQLGSEIDLPLAGRSTRFAVAGIWRDYARQNATLLIERARYIALTGDDRIDTLWLWLKPGASVESFRSALTQNLKEATQLEVRDPAEIRATSLALFDRTFAVTYVLEAVSVLIGLFAISVGASSQVLARRAEFGMLRHIGVTRGQISAMLALEGSVVGVIGMLYGTAVGSAISLILIHVINRQSFHWSMDVHMPWLALALLGIILVACAGLTALLSGRHATFADPIRAVKDDW